MTKTTLIGAGSDLGVHINGANLGPKVILNKINKKSILIEQDKNIVKSLDKNDLKKNIASLNKLNEKLYSIIKNENSFCITIGGDHSVAIASGLASLKKYDNLGLIWIDSHLDYNTFKTTITGNLHGMPLASLNGLNEDLSKFHNSKYYDPKKTVVIGYRAFEENAKAEINNIKTMGVTVYTTNDIKEYGVTKILEQAIKIASNNTSGIHISFDLDVIDPKIARGVSVTEIDGINLEETNEVIKILQNKKDLIKSFDLVEYNPLNDQDNQTLNIALDIINKMIK